MALIAVPASVSRVFVTGWRAVYGVHMLCLLLVVGLWLLRSRIDFHARAVIAVAIMNIVAIAGITTFGLLGSAWWWMFNAALLVSILFSIRAGLIHAAVSVVILCGAGLGFINGWLTLDFDANTYVAEYSAWLTMLFGPVQLTVFILWAISTYQDATAELLSEVDKRREQREALILELKQALEEVQDLRGLVPICAHCKKVRDDTGFWENVEAFIRRHANTELTHGLCPPCGVELYGELWHEAMMASPKTPVT